MDDENIQKRIKGTKCESCYDADWCWNALKESAKNDCLGPFNDLEYFRKKFDASNQEDELSKEIREKSLRILIWKSKVEEYREVKMLTDYYSSTEDKKEDE